MDGMEAVVCMKLQLFHTRGRCSLHEAATVSYKSD